MHVQPISTFRLFQEGHLLRNSIAIFALTTLFYFIGAELRLVHELSLFWPLNGVMAGVFARYVWLNRLHYYAISYVAMLVYDAITTEWGLVSLAINFSNMMFIVTVALLVARDKRLGKNKYEPVSALRLFNYCLIAALLCAIVGAIGSVSIDSLDFWPLLADWFSEQFSTGVLIVPPDSPIVRDRIVKRYHAKSRQPFDLLSEIGRDSVGAVTLIPEDETVMCPIMAWEKLTEARLEEVLTAYKADIPLGMIREENDFRISVAGAQEKTALLRIGNDWCIPKGITPTTHIIKLPIGEIRQPNATLDLSQSVDNEYYCLLLAKELGLNVPDAEIIKAGRGRALAVKRFDRRWNTERTVLLRLPQEDMCQTFGLPSSVKYESDGGPGIAQIMAFLMGSSEALKDRYDFMKFQVFQWLIGATDGHAKNFSVFIQAGGSYRLTPFYDIISAFPVLGGTGIHISDLKLAMGLNASKGKKTAIDKIYPRHFLATAKVLKFPEVQMHEILSDFARMIPAALDNVKTSLPTDFPENVVTAVETNVLRLHGRLSREYGIK
ncbi:TPA: HipA domain-containing protein [Escherichia coli]